MDWPQSFYELKGGEGCPMGEQGRPEETRYGARFLAGEASDTDVEALSA